MRCARYVSVVLALCVGNLWGGGILGRISGALLDAHPLVSSYDEFGAFSYDADASDYGSQDDQDEKIILRSARSSDADLSTSVEDDEDFRDVMFDVAEPKDVHIESRRIGGSLVEHRSACGHSGLDLVQGACDAFAHDVLAPSDISVEKYASHWLRGRRGVQACGEGLITFRLAFATCMKTMIPRLDGRMARGSLAIPEDLKPYEGVYSVLCGLYNQYLDVAVALDMGSVEYVSCLPHVGLQKMPGLQRLSAGTCKECYASFRSNDASCASCGELLMYIPEEDEACMQAYANILWLDHQTQLFGKAVTQCIQEMEDISF